MLLALLPLALAESYALADAGLTLDLPAGWEMTRWSDWDFKGRTGDGGVALEAWYTPWQLGATEDNAKAFAAIYRQKLDDMRADDVKMTSARVENIGGHSVARVDLTFAFESKGPKGVVFVAAFPLEGKVMHVMTLSAAQNATKAQRALETVVQRMSVQKAPADVAGLAGTLTTDLGFTATLPEGWRAPLPAEKAEVTNALGEVPVLKADTCGTAVRPLPSGTADVMLLCRQDWALGIVDELSFADEDALLKARLFGKAAEKLPPSEPIQAKDRVGFLLKPEINGRDLRMAVLPYDQGTLVGWAVGPTGDAAYLEEALRATTLGLAYAGPDNGVPKHEIGAVIVHTLTYDPFHPGVLLCVGASLAFLGGLGYLAFRPRKHAHDHHDHGHPHV